MTVFDGLESLGFSLPAVENVFTDNAKKQSGAKQEAKNEESNKPPDLREFLYEKAYECSACGNQFNNTTAKKGKLRFESSEIDLRPVYTPIDPIYYDVVLCKKCGYAAMQQYFNKISDRQGELIMSQIGTSFRFSGYPLILSADQAIERYKLALLTAMTKNSTSGEKAIICMRLTWLYRDKNDENNVRLFLQNTYKGLSEAYTKDTFPIGGIDEVTTAYLIGEMAFRLGDHGGSLKWLGGVITNRNASPRLKEKAQEIRDKIRDSKPE